MPPPVDLARLAEFSDGTAAGLRTLIEIFLQDSVETTAELHAAVESERLAEIELLAHRAGGASGACGAGHLAALLLQLEELARRHGRRHRRCDARSLQRAGAGDGLPARASRWHGCDDMKRILIIDDNQMLANVYRASLAGAGFAVEVAHDGEAGVAAARRTPPDLVLLDMMMPRMDGLGVLAALRADEALRAVPVIVCSNSCTPDRMDKLWQAGATQVLAKVSSTPRFILEAVRTALEAKS